MGGFFLRPVEKSLTKAKTDKVIFQNRIDCGIIESRGVATAYRFLLVFLLPSLLTRISLDSSQ